MATIERLRADWLIARKERKTVEATLLGTLVGAIQTKEKNFKPFRSLTEAEVIGEIKSMLDGVVQTGTILAASSGRDAELEKNAAERRVLEAYMPQQMTEAEIEVIVRKHVLEGKTMGEIMANLKAEFPGRYDGKLAAGVIKKVLA